MSNRVVITGVGAITPIGTGKDEFWKGLMEGRNGIDKISRFDASEFTAQIAGEVKDFGQTVVVDVHVVGLANSFHVLVSCKCCAHAEHGNSHQNHLFHNQSFYL